MNSDPDAMVICLPGLKPFTAKYDIELGILRIELDKCKFTRMVNLPTESLETPNGVLVAAELDDEDKLIAVEMRT